MISQWIRRSASTFTPLQRVVTCRYGSTLTKETSSKGNQNETKPPSEYLAADMYNYTTFSHYDMEADIVKYRLPQPSSYSPLKPDPPAPKK